MCVDRQWQLSCVCEWLWLYIGLRLICQGQAGYVVDTHSGGRRNEQKREREEAAAAASAAKGGRRVRVALSLKSTAVRYETTTGCAHNSSIAHGMRLVDFVDSIFRTCDNSAYLIDIQ